MPVHTLQVEKKHILRGHSEGVLALCFSPDSFALASGGDDGTVRMWDVASGNLRTIFTGEQEEQPSLVCMQAATNINGAEHSFAGMP